ncbi:copper amine oxidase N-terminal domain-containing protein [Paenibacillus polymyxa]|uniref:copper amine oxidase N-terminal domain-containing protein n=1 Tax=Paenibacillus polymyxa TaxID=1406 RepID=UPI0025B6624E|nr:copper amine oxidase N-terminal domain-containing protein [Paenibacillus polymyxa]MDN4106642.1 copper amine oxidase N-terminal domain-containing protein [Paenibacillus polymyxa]
MIKKMLLSISAASLLFVGSVVPTQAAKSENAKPIKVLLDAKTIQFPDAQPFQDDNDYVMVPIRFVSEALGAKVGWEKIGNKLAVSIKNDAHSVAMTVGQTTATVDGQTKSYETKIILKQNRTFVPLRLVSEGLGQTVEWDKVSRWVWIGKKEIAQLDTKGQQVSIEPYIKSIGTIPALLRDETGKAYDKVLIFKQSDLPIKLLRDIYSVEPYTTSDGVPYLRMRVKTKSSAGSIFYLTKNKDARLRAPFDELMHDNGDGTKMIYYPIYSSGDELFQGVKNYKSFKLKDIEYIGFGLQGDGYIPMMVNPWKGN